ncbi:MAG: hypothetical protein ABEJ30_06650 [Halorientalis sp.]
MTLHAVDDLTDAVEATRRFLVPPTLGRWLRLAVVAFFVGGFGFGVPAGGGTPPTGGTGDAPTGPGEGVGAIPNEVFLLAGLIVVAALVLWLLFAVVSAIMEFVFVESLRAESVSIREYARRYWRQGVRLFVFRTAVLLAGLLAILGVGALLATVVVGGPVTDWSGGDALVLILFLLPVGLLVFAVTGLVNGFTGAFVVPVMVAEGETVLGGWRRFWPTLRGQPRQYGAYVLVALVLAIATGFIAATATGIGAVVLAIPFVTVGALVVVAAGASFSTPVVVVLAILVLVYVLLVLTLVALVQVPLQTFLRYYSLLVLGDTNADFDVIPDARAAVRA